MKRRFSLKYEVFSEYISPEAVFTKTEMNNEWNVDFLQNTRYFQNISISKLYLPRQKWTMNETSIFFKIWVVDWFIDFNVLTFLKLFFVQIFGLPFIVCPCLHL